MKKILVVFLEEMEEFIMDNKYASQKEVVLDILNKKGSITSLEACITFRITRLSAVIFNLRKDGYDIISVQKHTTNRYGNRCQYVEYTKAW